MKISGSIRDLYILQLGINKNLENRVRELFESGKENGWFYKGRVKQLESFAQKLETGRFNPVGLEDFFACTIVVENRSAIADALKLVEKYCTIVSRRPRDETKTHKSPELFSFDDLRLYVKLKVSETSPVTPLDDIVFEVQIKTFLQHAWSIATHDLVYKGDSISWSKARLAFQIKAMLENAEISIEQVDNIAKSSALNMIDEKTQNLKDIIEWLESKWERDLLPKDIVRLSQTLQEIMNTLWLKLADIKSAVEADDALGLGSKITNLSPYEIIIKALVAHRSGAINKLLKDAGFRTKMKLFITPEMEIDDFVAGSLPARIEYARIKAVVNDSAVASAAVTVVEVRVTDNGEKAGTEQIRVEPAGPEQIRVEPVRVEPVKIDQVRVEPVRVEPVRTTSTLDKSIGTSTTEHTSESK